MLYFNFVRIDINGKNIGDIRGFYKYSFFCDDNNKVFMKLNPSAQNSNYFIVDIEKNNVDFTLPILQKKYGIFQQNVWKSQKLSIKEEKMEDLFSMRNYCETLTEKELEYWFPYPNNNFKKRSNNNNEEIEEIFWLEKKIGNNEWEENFLKDIEENIM